MAEFKLDPKLREQALTHSSTTKDDPSKANYERLEFFGDAVLKLIFSKYLFDRFPDKDEGVLTKYRSRLISDDLLSQVGKKMGLEKVIKTGSSMKAKKMPKSIIGDAVEALIGAIYIDQGYAAAEQFTLAVWYDKIEQAIDESMTIDYKSKLQEVVQKTYKKPPEYKTLGESGEDHERTFEVAVYLDEQELGKASGPSKKEAGQLAAKVALESLKVASPAA